MFGLFKTKEKTWNSMNDFLKTVLSQLNGRNINEFRHGLILPQKYSSLLPFLKAESSKWIMPNLRPEVEFLSEQEKLVYCRYCTFLQLNIPEIPTFYLEVGQWQENRTETFVAVFNWEVGLKIQQKFFDNVKLLLNGEKEIYIPDVAYDDINAVLKMTEFVNEYAPPDPSQTLKLTIHTYNCYDDLSRSQFKLKCELENKKAITALISKSYIQGINVTLETKSGFF